MLTNYYDVYYINGDYERLWRQEDMLACRFGNKNVKSIKHYTLTKDGWKVRTIL